jgi:hypothetical protein
VKATAHTEIERLERLEINHPQIKCSQQELAGVRREVDRVLRYMQAALDAGNVGRSFYTIGCLMTIIGNFRDACEQKKRGAQVIRIAPYLKRQKEGAV